MGQWLRAAGCVVVYAIGAVAPLLSQTSIAAAMLPRERSGLVTAGSTESDSGFAQPAASLEDALRTAFASAGVIFTGEVVSIDRTPAAVVVRWRVDDAVRGVSSGAIYEQKEWPGLWADGNGRYRVGERALVLLHAPSIGGYASPVGDGVIPLQGDAVTGTLDLRWLAQQVAVTDAAQLRPMLALRAAGGNLALSDAMLTRTAQAAGVSRAGALQRPPAPDGGDSNSGASVILSPPTNDLKEDPNAHVDGAIILGMLHAWQRAGAASR